MEQVSTKRVRDFFSKIENTLKRLLHNFPFWHRYFAVQTAAAKRLVRFPKKPPIITSKERAKKSSPG